MILKTDAIVLQVQKYRESSAIVTLYTQASGKMSVLAKGARRKNNALASILGVMNHVAVIIYWKVGRELQLVTQSELRRSPRHLVQELDRLGAGMSMIELVNVASHPEEKNEELFGRLRDCIAQLDHATNRPENALYYFEATLLDMLGFRPSLTRCVRCACDPLEQSGKTRKVACVVLENGLLCPACTELVGGGPEISLGAVQVLRRFQEISEPEAAERIRLTDPMKAELEGALRWLLRRHVIGSRLLKSEMVFSSLEHS